MAKRPIITGATGRKASKTKVRIASYTDVDRLVLLVNGTYRGESGSRGWTTEAEFISGQRVDREMVAELLNAPNSFIFVVDDESHAETSIIGCIHTRVDSKKSEDVRAHFGLLTVSVEWQNQGVGDQLLASAETFVRERFSANEMSMFVISIRYSLIAWYVRRGYKLIGDKVPFPYGQPRFGIPLREDLEFVVMSKQLL